MILPLGVPVREFIRSIRFWYLILRISLVIIVIFSFWFLYGPDDRIRTCGLMVPNHALYQTEPHPDMYQGGYKNSILIPKINAHLPIKDLLFPPLCKKASFPDPHIHYRPIGHWVRYQLGWLDQLEKLDKWTWRLCFSSTAYMRSSPNDHHSRRKLSSSRYVKQAKLVYGAAGGT